MKKFRFSILLLAAVGVLAMMSAVNADVPPDPGFKRISLKLVLEPQADFPDHRFFIRSGADLKEIGLKKGERVTIEPLGGGAWYRAGKLLAVPKKSLAGLSESPADGKLSEMQKAVYDGKAAGMIELVDHSFIRDVREADAAGWKDPVYNIETGPDQHPRAVLVSAGEREQKPDGGPAIGLYSREPKTGLFWGTVVGGSFMTLAFICVGVWFIRRSRSKAIQ